MVVTNLTRSHPGSQVGDHAVSAAGFLTGVWPKRTEAEDVLANTTIDQIVAKQIGQDTPFPSLEVATEDFTGYVGACSPGFNCSYMNTVAWSSPTTPLPMDINPRVVFERMFGQAGTAAARAARRRDDRSILDSITQEANSLQRGLGVRDRTRVGEYLDNLREIERRIQRAEAHQGSEVTIDAPIGVPESFEEHVSLMYDLLAVAYQADVTRVFTFMLSRELSQRTYPQIGVTEQHHSVSHHGNDPNKIGQNVKINVYHMGLFAKFLETAAGGARRRRIDPRSLADLLRRRHGEPQRPSLGSAARRRRRRRRQEGRHEGTSAHRAVEAHAGRQPVVDGGAEVPESDRDVRRQHRHGRFLLNHQVTIVHHELLNHEGHEGTKKTDSSDEERKTHTNAQKIAWTRPDADDRSTISSCPLCPLWFQCRGSRVRVSLVVLLLVATLSAGGAEVRLLDAVKAGNRDAVRALLKKPAPGNDVNAAEPDGTTALHWAVRADDQDIGAAAAARGREAECRQSLRRDADLARRRQRQRGAGRHAPGGRGRRQYQPAARRDAC